MRGQETKNLAEYVRKLGVNISKMSRETGISYMAIYDSLFNDSRDRELRTWEFFAICKFLHVNPMDFADKEVNKVDA